MTRPKISLNLTKIYPYQADLDHLVKYPKPMYPEWRTILKCKGELIINGQRFPMDYIEVIATEALNEQNSVLAEALFPELVQDIIETEEPKSRW